MAQTHTHAHPHIHVHAHKQKCERKHTDAQSYLHRCAHDGRGQTKNPLIFAAWPRAVTFHPRVKLDISPELSGVSTGHLDRPPSRTWASSVQPMRPHLRHQHYPLLPTPGCRVRRHGEKKTKTQNQDARHLAEWIELSVEWNLTDSWTSTSFKLCNLELNM